MATTPDKKDCVLVGPRLLRDIREVRDRVLRTGPTGDAFPVPPFAMISVLRRGRMNVALTKYDTSGNATATPIRCGIGVPATTANYMQPFKVIDIHGYSPGANKVCTFALADDGRCWYPIGGEC